MSLCMPALDEWFEDCHLKAFTLLYTICDCTLGLFLMGGREAEVTIVKEIVQRTGNNTMQRVSMAVVVICWFTVVRCGRNNLIRL